MTNTKIDPVNLNSDLRNFRDSEVEILARYTEQFKKSALQRPEMTLYNWTRFVRTNEITRFLTFYETYKHIQEIQGSVFQVGVLEGNTLFSFAHLIENFEARNIPEKFTRSTLMGLTTIHRFRHMTRSTLTVMLKLYRKCLPLQTSSNRPNCLTIRAYLVSSIK